MQNIAIRELKTNPSLLTKYLDEGQSVFVTKHGRPVGLTIPLTDDLFSMGIKKAVALEQYKNGVISMGKMAEIIGISKKEAMRLLNDFRIEWVELSQNELDEQMALMENLTQ